MISRISKVMTSIIKFINLMQSSVVPLEHTAPSLATYFPVDWSPLKGMKIRLSEGDLVASGVEVQEDEQGRYIEIG